MTAPLDENWLPPGRHAAARRKELETSSEGGTLGPVLLIAMLIAPVLTVLWAWPAIKRSGAVLWSCVWTGIWCLIVITNIPRLDGATPPTASSDRGLIEGSEGRMSDVEGQVLCQRLIESQARWDYEWTGFFGSPEQVVFSRSLGANGRAELTVFGSGLRLQNGFGAWSHHQFRCTFDTGTKLPSAIDVF